MQLKLASFALICLSLVGCARFDPMEVRREHTDSYGARLSALSEEELGRPLSLDDCIRIAMVNNYEARKADLHRDLYRIGKNLAFTAFLPTVAASAGYNTFAKDPQVTEKRFGTAGVDIGMPIFMPSTWFLYMTARHGYVSAEMVAAYVRQAIVMQTTADYISLLLQQDIASAIESQLIAAREASDRIQGFAREGFFMQWESDQALYLAEAREAELNRARRQVAVAKAELLQGMGLSPLAPVEISGELGEIRMPEGSIEDLVLRALEVHPELAIADRLVVISEHQVRQAFCDFLPVVSVFSSGSWTGNDLAIHSANWVSGLSAVWTVFDGLANVARYQASKNQRMQTELERENTFLSIIVRVVTAEAAVRNAAEAALIRERAFHIASAKYADYDARAREGLLPLSDSLDARAEMDLAQVEYLQSRYQERVAISNLQLAMGITLVPELTTEEEK